jgi:hypothetical protein
VVGHHCNLNTWEAKVGGSRISAQPRLHSEFKASVDYIDPVSKQNKTQTRHWWLTPVILAAQDAEIRRIRV